jgi:two-component system KDP operon response regulator KdpE
MKLEHSDHKVLVVDDDPRLIRLLSEVLMAAGYQVITRVDGEKAIETVAVEQPDLVILDIILGDLDGYEVCRRLREFSDTPIIMLTAKVKESELLEGFNAGADDYITKPFSSKELLARVHAVLNRSQTRSRVKQPDRIDCGDLKIDLAKRQVSIAGEAVYLTATEYNLLYHLATHPNQVMLHENLLTKVWGPEYRDDVDYLRSYIHYLRKKLERDPANPEIILNIPAVGYMLATQEQEKEEDVSLE